MRKTIKKAQYGKRTPMQILKERFPKADTTAAGDLRFADLGNVARYPKKDQDYIRANQAAFDKKFGKGKPAKNQMGGKTPKAQVGKKVTKASQAAKKMGPTYVKNPLREQQDFLMKQKAKQQTKPTPNPDAFKKGGVTKKAQKGTKMTTKYKNGGTLSPTKKSVGKTIGKLNKAKYGSKTSKKK